MNGVTTISTPVQGEKRELSEAIGFQTATQVSNCSKIGDKKIKCQKKLDEKFFDSKKAHDFFKKSEVI